MKKTLYIAAAVIAVMFAASCQKDDVQAAKKGMTLSANVEETKATIEKDGIVWHFNWETGDVVKVTSPSNETYSFVYDGTSFKCETAVPKAGKWTAVYYPADFETNGFNLLKQDGTKEYVADHMLLKGDKTYESAVSTLSMTMTPQLAVLALKNGPNSRSDAKYAIKVDGSERYYKILNADGTWVTDGMRANCYLNAFTEIGQTQYFVVPAGVPIVVRGFSFASVAKKLTAGKVYTLTTDGR